MSDDIKDGKMDESKCNKIRDYKSAFDCFVQRFLVDKKSIFRLNEEDTILTTKSIEFLIKNFIEKGMDGEKGITFIDKMIWREMYDFSEDCVLLVIASDYYDESDYIRDYDEFLRVVNG